METRGDLLLIKECAVLALTLLLTLLYTGTARADTFTATNTANSGTGSLREAISKTNASEDADEIRM